MKKLALSLALVACSAGESDHADSPFDLRTALLVGSRDHLEVCVQPDAALAATGPALVERISAELDALASRHPDWHAAGLDRGPATAALGCPGAAPVDWSATLGLGRVDDPSPYRTYIYVLADDAAPAVLGDAPFARAVAELLPQGDHVVAEVSTALIVRASAIGSPEFRDIALPDAVGLAPLREVREPE